ncbi:MAG: MotA/TolQ/ExbB proton channel family protein, partial [Synergistaceae bacterium]|nr:MotA/TolQ/ExbB proton channel family protein [Synergistaceae bacterium]
MDLPSMTFMDYMSSGGSIMWIILALSVIALAVVLERMFFFIGASADLEKLKAVFAGSVSRGDSSAAREALAGRSSMHRLFSAAYENWKLDGKNLETFVEGRIRSERYRGEKNLALLELIAKISPLLGLLGTVLGMVEMFRTLNLGGSVSAEAVTGGIWKALFTTVAGLVVAIPVLIAHGMLMGWITREEELLDRGGLFIVMEHSAG